VNLRKLHATLKAVGVPQQAAHAFDDLVGSHHVPSIPVVVQGHTRLKNAHEVRQQVFGTPSPDPTIVTGPSDAFLTLQLDDCEGERVIWWAKALKPRSGDDHALLKCNICSSPMTLVVEEMVCTGCNVAVPAYEAPLLDQMCPKCEGYVEPWRQVMKNSAGAVTGHIGETKAICSDCPWTGKPHPSTVT